MNEYYTHKQVMDRLGLVSVAALQQLKKKYPYAFVVIRHVRGKATLYEKQALDKFIELRKSLIVRSQP
jgi:hypothetical protein